MNATALTLLKNSNKSEYERTASEIYLKSEQRIINNRIRRQKEQQRNIIFTVSSLCIAVLFCFCVNGFLSNAETAVDRGPEAKYYASVLVENGDTLWQFARDNMGNHYENESVYVQEVININSLREEKIIAGQHLVIPYFSSVKGEK